jgi:hypothetical protein
LEAQNFGVEIQSLGLIVDEDAGEFDLHGLSILLRILRFWQASRLIALPAGETLKDRTRGWVGEGFENVVRRSLHSKTITNWLWFVKHFPRPRIPSTAKLETLLKFLRSRRFFVSGFSLETKH